ncbi:hypothetical protein EDI_198120 [Entamoeba dispar SAW760]|uniref:Uncharacterized protein n=1 Tax=Entamoeba dispar (strain ATCC PRA-260 / SAW760) TaxID=370354 RepID=B0EPH8_ENTDS|nr:uncharacterized protein EDI_198120 [Entamoeba dispar SAW760]EDR23586.1 hypothetical protein EDI_198120 [Entamoeba dispar SAW760]|eukprot:EDR23586.1 hypothetical protein EDI_198120 [Entamoeba dispar SAW760]
MSYLMTIFANKYIHGEDEKNSGYSIYKKNVTIDKLAEDSIFQVESNTCIDQCYGNLDNTINLEGVHLYLSTTQDKLCKKLETDDIENHDTSFIYDLDPESSSGSPEDDLINSIVGILKEKMFDIIAKDIKIVISIYPSNSPTEQPLKVIVETKSIQLSRDNKKSIQLCPEKETSFTIKMDEIRLSFQEQDKHPINVLFIGSKKEECISLKGICDYLINFITGNKSKGPVSISCDEVSVFISKEMVEFCQKFIHKNRYLVLNLLTRQLESLTQPTTELTEIVETVSDSDEKPSGGFFSSFGSFLAGAVNYVLPSVDEQSECEKRTKEEVMKNKKKNNTADQSSIVDLKTQSSVPIKFYIGEVENGICVEMNVSCLSTADKQYEIKTIKSTIGGKNFLEIKNKDGDIVMTRKHNNEFNIDAKGMVKLTLDTMNIEKVKQQIFSIMDELGKFLSVFMSISNKIPKDEQESVEDQPETPDQQPTHICIRLNQIELICCDGENKFEMKVKITENDEQPLIEITSAQQTKITVKAERLEMEIGEKKSIIKDIDITIQEGKPKEENIGIMQPLFIKGNDSMKFGDVTRVDEIPKVENGFVQINQEQMNELKNGFEMSENCIKLNVQSISLDIETKELVTLTKVQQYITGFVTECCQKMSVLKTRKGAK